MTGTLLPKPTPEPEVKRPGLASQIIPYLITFAIFFWIFRSVPFRDVWTNLLAADLSYFLPAMIVFLLVFFLADVFSFGQAYRWFNAPDITLREMMECRGAPYVIQIGLAPLAETLFPLYLWRRKGVRISQALSSNIWTFLNDGAAIMTAISAAVIYNFWTGLVPALGPAWLVVVVVFWTFYLGNLYFWHSHFRERAVHWIAGGAGAAAEEPPAKAKQFLRQAAAELLQLLRTFSVARWHQYLRVYLVRLVMWGFSLLSNYAALRAVGVDPPLPLAGVAIPLIVLSIFQPISVGGYGGPQLIAVYFFSRLSQSGTEAAVLAYSLLWSTCFLVGRAVIGVIFIRGFWRATFPEGFRRAEKRSGGGETSGS